ncbi:hypothetical protein OIDMADRAFT_16832 [Oidiodendron maius Zn]|uniref:Alcohol dehydrogenase-like C-terminal domain-containing protein n=1 Tax=Oidiodendron maius (strain Zn) TaxID=913774 RepID=A0A0C3D2I4_OIDMZ|nr:hypothetical protein OIDMADRAFT_16832 [Oidiodendron maius Zn]
MVLEIVSRTRGNKFVALGFPYDGEIPDGVESKYIIGNSIAQNDLDAAVFANYQPRALAEWKFIPAPEPLVAGRGLEGLETAFGIVRDGVSARNVVVSLE